MLNRTVSRSSSAGLTRLLRALTLIEVLAVVVIVAVLAAFLFPVFARAKGEAKRTDCLSKLHQAGLALSIYAADAGNEPLRIGLDPDKKPVLLRAPSALAPYIGGSGTRAMLCPWDSPKGRSLRLEDRTLPRSFLPTWNLWEGEDGKAAWERLETLDSNPVMFRCFLHDDYLREELRTPGRFPGYGADNGTPSLLVYRDGSVKNDRKVRTGHDSGDTLDVKKLLWRVATEVLCPLDICDGSRPRHSVAEF